MKTPLFPTAGAPCLTRGARADSITPSQKRTCVLDADPLPGGPRLPLPGSPGQDPGLAQQALPSYTAKGNLVAVVTNGTAVLGVGNIGPLAGKPVMEGKGVGMAQPVRVLQRGSEVNDIVNMAVIAAVDAQEHGRRSRA